MNASPSERFHETLLGQYRDLILEAFLESESNHRTTIDRNVLSSKLREILKCASIDGVSPRELQLLIDEARAQSDLYQRTA